ncbi:MAG: hypothetical protein HY959_06770 [Ignavibacteriae bacterium]|nr:hypothetical protein [Ignavibacteriota bacterium]
MKKNLTIIIIFLFCSLNISFAQFDLGTVIQKVGPDYAAKYLSPFTTGLGTNLNSGFLGGYSPSGYSKIPIWPHVYAGVKFTGVMMKNNDKFFDYAFTTDTVIGGVHQTIDWIVEDAPTVFGNSKPALAKGVSRQTHQVIYQEMIGGIEDTKFIPLVIPQIGVGTILGTDIIFRTIPGIKVGDYGKFSLVGGAIRHCIGSYAKMPFDIAVQFGFQNFSIKDVNNNKFVDASSMFTNLQINKSFPIVSIYGGLQYETYNVDVNYKYGSTMLSFSQKGDNHFRGIAGATVSLGPARFNADMNFGSIFAFTAGFGFGI